MLSRGVADLKLALLDGEQYRCAVPEVLRIEGKIVFLINFTQRRPQRAHGADLKTFAKRVSRLRWPHQHRRQGDRSAGCSQRHSKATSSDVTFLHTDVSVPWIEMPRRIETVLAGIACCTTAPIYHIPSPRNTCWEPPLSGHRTD